MIVKSNVKLDPPICRINDESLLENNEVDSLLDSIADFFRQKNISYDAELTVSNNEWKDVYNKFGERIGKKRKDITIDLSELTHIILDKGELIFKIKLSDEIFRIKVTDKFFYFFDYEENFYN